MQELQQQREQEVALLQEQLSVLTAQLEALELGRKKFSASEIILYLVTLRHLIHIIIVLTGLCYHSKSQSAIGYFVFANL